MKLIIPMAGRGTRLRPHSHITPKPLLPVAGTMIVERIIETFKQTVEGTFTEIAFVLGDFGEEIKQQLADMTRRHGAEPVFYYQDEALGTAHAVDCAAGSLEGEVVIVFADTLFDMSQKVQVGDADSVIWLKEVEDPSRFGVAVHENNRITGFVEKPDKPVSNLAIIGVYYFRQGEELRKQIRYLIDNNIIGHGNEFQLTDAIDRMLKEQKVFKPATVDDWMDCGTIPAWIDTSAQVIHKENGGMDPAGFPGSTFHQPVYIGEGAQIEQSEIGPNVTIEAGAHISGSRISNAIILQQADIRDSVLDQSTVGRHARVEGFSGELHISDHSRASRSG